MDRKKSSQVLREKNKTKSRGGVKKNAFPHELSSRINTFKLNDNGILVERRTKKEGVKRDPQYPGEVTFDVNNINNNDVQLSIEREPIVTLPSYNDLYNNMWVKILHTHKLDTSNNDFNQLYKMNVNYLIHVNINKLF